MVTRILVSLDGISVTKTAVRYAVELAQVRRAEVRGITVVDRRRLSALLKTSGAAQDAFREFQQLEAMQRRHEDAITHLVSACEEAGVRHTVARETGDPDEKLILQARHHDLVIFGLQSSAADTVPGAFSPDDLVRLTLRGGNPILAVSNTHHHVKRVLLMYSGTTESATAIKRFMQMRLWPELSVNIVAAEQGPAEAKGLLSEIGEYCSAYGHKVTVKYMAGSSHQQLLEYASDWNAELIVVGNIAKRLWLGGLLKQTAVHVIQHARIPVFVA